MGKKELSAQDSCLVLIAPIVYIRACLRIYGMFTVAELLASHGIAGPGSGGEAAPILSSPFPGT